MSSEDDPQAPDPAADLLAAARAWRGALIPRTSTATWSATAALLEAIAAFDRPPCQHPRSWRSYKNQHLQADEVCDYCGTVIKPGLTHTPVSDAPVISYPPSSSSSSPSPDPG